MFTLETEPLSLAREMPDWNRIIVGDAFKASSRDINYYRDLALLWPFLLFSLVAISHLYAPGSPAQRIYGFKSAVCAIAAILLAKERLILFMGGLLYVAVQLTWALRSAHNWTDWRVPLGLLVSGGLVVVISAITYRNGWKPRYTWPKKMYILDVLVGVASLGGTIALVRWMKP
jgi:hypothetical protein